MYKMGLLLEFIKKKKKKSFACQDSAVLSSPLLFFSVACKMSPEVGVW